MTGDYREKLSTLMDEEVETDEIDDVLKHLEQDEALRLAWGRYHMIRDAMRGESVRPEYMDIAAAVRSRLENEPTVLAPRGRRSRRSHWIRQVGGIAMAASLVAAAILVIPHLLEGPGLTGRDLAQETARDVRTSDNAVVAALVKQRQSELAARLNLYLESHQNYAPVSHMQGMRPYASLIGFNPSH